MSSKQEKELIPLTESELFVRQSDENVELFDPQRITDALARETNLASETAHKIALEVKEQIGLSGIRALTAPLIRGLVDAKLLEHGLMNEYRLHSRLGVPIYDVDRIIQSVSGDTAVLHGPEGSSLALAEAIKREYAIRNVFSDAVSNAHLVGDLHIENLGEVDRPTTMIGSVDFIKRHGVRLPGGFAGSRPAKRAEVLVLHLVTYTAALQGYFSETLSWDSVNFALAPLLVGLNQREIKQIAQGLLFELSAPAIARGGQPVRCDLHLDCEAPAYLRDLQIVGAGGEKFSSTYGAMEETARDFLKALFEVYLEGDGQGLPFTGPRPILHLTESFIGNPFNRGVLDLVIRAATERGGVTLAFDRPSANPAATTFTARYGVGADKLQRAGESWQWRAATLSSVAINLPRVGYRAPGDPSKIFGLLTSLLELAAQASLEKRIFLEKLLARGESGALAMLAMRPGQEIFLPLGWTAHAICPVGLAELAQIATGDAIDLSQPAQDFAASVIAHLNAEAERLSVKHKVRFTLAESRDVTAPHRLARLDLRFAGQASAVNPDNESAAEVFYTNSIKLPAQSDVNAFDRIRIESELQGGMIRNAVTDLWLGAALPAPEKLGELISKAFHKTQTTAITFSPEFTVCDVCHTVLRGLLSNCPQCGSMRVDGLAQSTNRYSRTSTWPRWKLAELNQRKHEEL
ncbi:MAG TPA: anaerobic ribonucleoside-triphosphate reductase [Blastocatellia bacterium]|nr:anaerobic ribonucleoside-triphosphate reductase [Blastocatellia bacterium]HKE04649.1 anaerobic ribonucleoside-triphosphate reductase [Blastocatellia bacterium]